MNWVFLCISAPLAFFINHYIPPLISLIFFGLLNSFHFFENTNKKREVKNLCLNYNVMLIHVPAIAADTAADPIFT